MTHGVSPLFWFGAREYKNLLFTEFALRAVTGYPDRSSPVSDLPASLGEVLKAEARITSRIESCSDAFRRVWYDRVSRLLESFRPVQQTRPLLNAAKLQYLGRPLDNYDMMIQGRFLRMLFENIKKPEG
jgi:hypothetical protein